MEALHDFLASSATLRLFAVIGLGYVVGAWNVRGFSLGVSAVLFVGLGLGAWDPEAFLIPPVVAHIGLALFVYTIGLASGPGVFRALSTPEGVRLSLLTFVAVLASADVTVGTARLVGLPGAQAAGIFCGAITNTPALAAQLELAQRTPGLEDKEGPAVGYSVCYPFGVLGVFAVMGLLMHWPGRQPEDEVKAYQESQQGSHGPVVTRNYRVTKLKPNGNQLEAGWLTDQTGLLVARRLHDDQLDIASPDSVLSPGDVVLAVGTQEMHDKAAEMLGVPAPERLEAQQSLVVYSKFFVSNPELVGQRLGDLHLEARFRTIVTRVRRGDQEVPASPGWVLEEGDVVRVVGRSHGVEKAGQLFGDSLEQIAATDFLSVALGMVLGVMLGSVPIPLGEAPYPTLGVAGGCLVVALIWASCGEPERLSGRCRWRPI